MGKKYHYSWHFKSFLGPLIEQIIIQTLHKSEDILPGKPIEVDRKLFYDNIWPLFFRPRFKKKGSNQKYISIASSYAFIVDIRVLGNVYLDEIIQALNIEAHRSITATWR